MRLLRPVREGLAREGRATAIEGLRGVVVVAVVGYHLLRLLLTRQGGNWGSTATAWWWWAGIARFAVDAFFVLAGLFIVASWRSSRTWRDYAARRARRILPPFLVTALAFGIPLTFLRADVDGGDLALFLTTQGYLDPGLPARVNLPSWSLTTEVQFYAVAPLVAAAVRWRKGGPLLALTLVTSVLWIHGIGRGDLAPSLLPGRLDQFVAGAVAGELVATGAASRLRRLVTRPAAGAVLVLLLLALGTWHGATFEQEAGGNSWVEDATHPIGGVLIAALLLRWLSGSAPRFLSATPWRFLGLVSFGIYLWHYPVLLYGLDWLGVRGDGPAPAPPAVLLACLALVGLSVALATAGYVLVEARFAARRVPRARLPHAEGAAAPAGTAVGPLRPATGGGEELGGGLPRGLGVRRAREHPGQLDDPVLAGDR